MSDKELTATTVVRQTEIINQKLRELLLNPFAFDEAKKEEILQDMDMMIAQLRGLQTTSKTSEDSDA